MTIKEVSMTIKIDECKLISGKEALIALANGESVEYMDTSGTFKSLGWGNAFGLGTNLFFLDRFKFRLKPRTISINGIEVPAPFEPKVDDEYFYIHSCIENGYALAQFESIESDFKIMQFGAWRTEKEVKQVVAALRQIFGGSHD